MLKRSTVIERSSHRKKISYRREVKNLIQKSIQQSRDRPEIPTIPEIAKLPSDPFQDLDETT